ncbi:olfactory receptor 2G3-like [Hyperolius riggenbachi]|uniref:olfactory receptor 2G3-like n=1 Tax=Hyperolius riggenbachi TaxID=752182 RepID=UPI0035A2F7F3
MSMMGPRNMTYVTEFILVGFSQRLQTRVLLFVFLLTVYVLSIFGNLVLIFSYYVSPRMRTPMYFFLCNLSFLDLCYSSSSLPKMLLDVFSKQRRISLIGCIAQMNITLYLGEAECILLAVMAYDRYIAICFPLNYTSIMTMRICRNITIMMWLGNFMLSAVPTLSKPLVFCRGNEIDHFACEIVAVLELVCGDVRFYKLTMFIVSLFTLLAPVAFIIVTYTFIISSVLKIRSVEGRSRAFSTCASHLTVVFMFFGPIITLYMAPANTFSSSQKYLSLMYGAVTPILNPLVYSLRNNDVKDACKKILSRYTRT